MTSRFRTSGPLRAAIVTALIALLLPSVWYAWRWRGMPHASEYHDDGIYFVSAQSLAATNTYEIGSLPMQPAQSKYPPLWPAVLSIAWRLSPHYPGNLPIAMFLCWIWLPLTLLAYRKWLELAELSSGSWLLLCAIWALNPYVVLFSTTMLSEMLFTFLLLASLLCLHPQRRHWAALAGVLAGLTFLTRTAGIALFPAAAIWYLAQERDRAKRFGLFAAGMLPAVLGWSIWAARHRAPGNDAISLYYTNYVGHYLSNFQWDQALLYVWKNLDGMLHGLGSLLLPDITHSVIDKVLAESLAIAGILGIVRLVRKNRRSMFVPYAAFAGCYALLLAVWHFPPTERFMLPVAPLWFAGLFTEMRHLAGNIAIVFRKPDWSQKFAGGLIGGLLALVFIFCGLRQWELLSTGLPHYYEDHAEKLRQTEPAMIWIREHVPIGATFLSENDPLLYLRTGRRGAGLEVLLPTIHWYRDEQALRTAGYAGAAVLAKSLKLDYFLLNDWDYARDLPPAEQAELIQALKQDPRFEQLYRAGPTGVYRLR